MPVTTRYGPSAIFLIAANLLPLAGVLAWGWDVFTIVFLYWVENVIIGAINVLKMICSRPDPGQLDLSALRSAGRGKSSAALVDEVLAKEGPEGIVSANTGAKFFLIPFFVVHYGMFCLVHGVFVFALFGSEDGFGGPLEMGAGVEAVLRGTTLLAALGLAASHLFSFFVNYLGGGEYRRTAVALLMMQPYGRIIVLHVSILAGGFAVTLLGAPVIALALLVVLKTGLDLRFHLREREKNAAARGAAAIPEKC